MSVRLLVAGGCLSKFLDPADCLALEGSCRSWKHFFVGDTSWQKEVVLHLKQICKQFAFLDPETRALLRERVVYNPTTRQFVQEGVKQLRSVCDQMREGGLKPQDKAVIVRHAVAMATVGCHLPVDPLLVSLEGGLDGKGKIESGPIVVLTRDNVRIAKLMVEKAPKSWPCSYEKRKLNACCAAYETAVALGSRSVAPTRMLQDGMVAQRYIPNASTLHVMLHREDGISNLASINRGEAQLHMLCTLIRGRTDSNLGNTIVAPDGEGAFHLFDIDEEWDFPDTNGSIADGVEECAIQMGVMGLPQAGMPLSKAVLQLFSLPGWKEKCCSILKRYGLSSAMQACALRCDKIRAICLAELERENSKITPRDFFFAIYGKDYLFEVALKHKETPMEFFHRVVLERDDFYSERFNLPMYRTASSDRGCKALRELESLSSPCEFSLAAPVSEKFPVKSIVQRVKQELSKKTDSIRCLQILPELFDQTHWKSYQKEHPAESVEIRSFMLSHFLSGFPKRIARLLSRLYPNFSLQIIKDGDKKLWLELNTH